jgi:hypothetical protein
LDPAATHRGFTRHAFISYSHIDNQPLPAEPAGWVTIFHAALEQFLSRFLGGKASIWRDEKLRGNDDFSEEILAQLPTAAALVMVLTPRYLNSEWCTRELNAFCEAVRAAKGPGDDSKSRIFKVIKTPVQNEAALPQEVSRVLGYEFFKFDDERTPRELDPVFGAQERQEFLRKVNKLAWDIKVLIERQLGAPQSASASAQTRPVVYLAEGGRAATRRLRGGAQPAVACRRGRVHHRGPGAPAAQPALVASGRRQPRPDPGREWTEDHHATAERHRDGSGSPWPAGADCLAS